MDWPVMEWTFIVPVLIAAIAPLGAYLLAARRMSGKIATSDATDLWAESKDIRTDYRLRLEESNQRVEALEKRIDKLEDLNTSHRHEIEALKGQIATFQLTIKEMETVIYNLRQDKAVLEKEIDNE